MNKQERKALTVLAHEAASSYMAFLASGIDMTEEQILTGDSTVA